MSATQTFASTGEDAISRSIDVQTQETPKHDSDEFNLYYEVERTAGLIEEGDYKRVRRPNMFPSALLIHYLDSLAISG